MSSSLVKEKTKKRVLVAMSGGVDSSSVTAYASKEVQDNHLKTFSIGFKEDSFDESEYSNQIAAVFKTDHHLEMLSMEKARDLLRLS